MGLIIIRGKKLQGIMQERFDAGYALGRMIGRLFLQLEQELEREARRDEEEESGLDDE